MSTAPQTPREVTVNQQVRAALDEWDQLSDAHGPQVANVAVLTGLTPAEITNLGGVRPE